MMARFFTEDGIEVPAVTAAQMREIDRIATLETGPNLFQMMENAGRSLALEAMARLGVGWRSARVLVLAGIGGNGGGGICAARHLLNRGVDARVCLAEPDRLGDITAQQRRTYLTAGGREVRPDELGGSPATLILDAVLGYGLRGAPRAAAAALIEWAGASMVPVLALDVPSGLEATTGQTPGAALRAAWTLTLALPKTGLREDRCGELVLADLGIPAAVYRRIGLEYTPPFGSGFRVALRRRQA